MRINEILLYSSPLRDLIWDYTKLYRNMHELITNGVSESNCVVLFMKLSSFPCKEGTFTLQSNYKHSEDPQQNVYHFSRKQLNYSHLGVEGRRQPYAISLCVYICVRAHLGSNPFFDIRKTYRARAALVTLRIELSRVMWRASVRRAFSCPTSRQ